MTNTWSQTVIFPAITTNLSPHRTIDHIIIIITVDSQCDRHELGPYPWARLLIALVYTLQRLAHYTHTTEAMASHSHSGGPTAFRQNRSTAMTLSRPLRLTPHWASPGWPRVYQRHNDHRRGPSQTGTKARIIQPTGTQGYVRQPDQGKHAHNLP